MTNKILATAAFSLMLGGAAFAQSGSSSDTSAQNPNMPAGWDQTIVSAFFSDPSTGTLKSQDEVTAAYQGLSSDEQAKVDTECSSMSASAAGSTTTNGASSDTMTTSSTSTDNSGSAGSGTSAGAGNSADMLTASLQQVCNWVGNK